MKKVLLIILVLCSVVLTFGQPLQTTVVFYEDFNTYTGSGVSADLASSGTFLSTDVHHVKFEQDASTQPVQQWKMNFKHPISALQSQTFPYNAPYCMYSTTNVNGSQWVGTLSTSKVRSKPILTPQNISGMTKAYLSFAQICKLHPFDSCYVEIQCTNDTLQTNWAVTKRLNFSTSSCYYFGSATSVGPAGVWSAASYSTWSPDANPSNTWWKQEAFDITQFIEPGYQYMRIVFAEQYYGLQTPMGRGWFIDDVKVTYANAEIYPPEMPVSGSALITGNRNNETGPWNISMKMRDRDTIDLTSIELTYTVRGVAQPNPTVTITADAATGSGLCRWHNVTANWVIPSLCYGDTVDYTITACDVHGSCTSMNYQFIPRSTKSNITANDVEMIGFVGMPSCVKSHHDTVPVLARFLNRSMNDMTHLKVGTTVVHSHRGDTTTTNLPDAEWFWTNDTTSFCMDWIDTVLAANFIPVEPGWYTITVYVKERNHALDDGTISNNSITINFFACDSALSGAYTYGTNLSAIRNMKELKDYLRCCGISDDVVLNMAAGNYGNITFQDTIYDGQDLYTITFQSATGNSADVHIYDNTTQNTYGAITLQGVKGFAFNNLTIHGKTSGTASLGVSFINKGSENITISNCNILINNASSRTNTSYSGIARLTANATNSIPDNNVSIVNNQISGGNFGIYYKGGTGATQKNLISNVSGNNISTSYKGIYSNYNNITHIDKNVIHQSSGSNPPEFIGIHLEISQNVETIDGNYVNDVMNPKAGIHIQTTNGTATQKTLISNNEILMNMTISNAYGIYMQTSNYISIVNNSVRLYSTQNLQENACLYFPSGATNNIDIYNNMLSNECMSAVNKNYAIDILTLPTQLNCDYNNYYSTGQFFGFYQANRATIAEWQQAIGGTNEQHSKSVQPPFENPTAHLKLDTYDGFECQKHLRVLKDILDSNRSDLTFMGAYTTSVPNVNMAAKSMASPNLAMVCYQPTIPVNLTVTNVGGNNFIFSTANPLKAFVKIYNTATGTTTIDSTTVTTGNLIPLDELVVPITTYTLQPNELLQFTFYIFVQGDAIAANDTLRTTYIFDQISMDASLGQNEFTEEFSHDLTAPYWKIQQIQGAGNWTVQQGTGVLPPVAPVYGTGRLFFNAKDFPITPTASANPVSRIVMPSISLVNAVNPILEIWYAHTSTSSASASNRLKEGIVVKVSNNGQQTFTTLKPNGFTAAGDTMINNYKTGYTTPAWVKYTYNLNAYDEATCVHIAIDAYGVGGANINIDKITLRNVLDYDIKVNDVYYYSEFPTQYDVEKDKIKINVSNLGAQNMNFGVKVEVKGANNFVYTTAPNAYSLNTNVTQTIEVNSFPAVSQIDTNGNNTLYVSILSSQDQDSTNSILSKQLTTSDDRVSYIDSNSHIVALGGTVAGTQLANKIPVSEELIVKKIYFMPVSALAPQYNNADVIGKRVIAFVSDNLGIIRVTSDTVTITAEMVGTLVEVPLNFFALSNVTDAFYAGVRLLDAGNYIAGQVESPIRENVFYTLNGTTYTAQNIAKAMIGAIIDQSMSSELEIMQVISPVTNCDLGHNDITIRITNNGTQTIVPGTIFHCWINDSIHFIDTLNVSLARQQVMDFTFSQHYNFANNQVGIDSVYNLFIYAEKLTTDRNQMNDTLDYDFSSLGKSNVPIVVTPQNVNYYNSINLTATFPSSIPQQDGELLWWSNTGFEQWKLEHIGDIYTTPLIFFDTTFYVSVAPGHIYDTTIGNGTANGTHPFLFGTANPYSRGRAIYKETEIKHIAPIEKIGLNVSSVGANTAGIPIKIYMKSTSLNTLTSSGTAQNTWINWSEEISDATLVYDGLLETPATGWIELQLNQFYNYQGGNLMILTETRNSVTPAANPQFRSTSSTNMAQACGSATDTSTLWRMTNNANRVNMKFYFSALNCASEKVPIQIVVPNRPTYDVETAELVYPYTSCNLENEYIVVRIKNMISNTIPANKVLVSATFNGITITDTIREAFAPMEDKSYTFTVPFTFTAAGTANVTFNYNISTTLIGETNIYTANDVITGSFVSNRTAWLPDTIHVTGEYTQPYTIHLHNWAIQNSSLYPLLGTNTADYTHSFFYKDPVITTAIAGGSAGVASYTTPALFKDTVFYIEAKTEGTPTSTCKTKRTVFMIHIIIPDHDLTTLELNSPSDYTCDLTNVNLSVKVKNIKAESIPAGTFKIKANFTGTATRSVEHIINQEIAPNAIVDILFTNTVLLGSTTVNSIYNYVITVEPISPTMVVYRNNDTITGSLKVPANPAAPANINQSVPYGTSATIVPTSSPLNYYYFYNSAGTTLLGEGLSFTTPVIYSTPVTYKYSGRIMNDPFDTVRTLGTGSTANAAPFDFAATTGSSIGIILYTAAEMGGYSGRIDTIAIQVNAVAFGEIPIQLYLKNDVITSLTSSTQNWNTLASQSKLIYDGTTDFSNENGWWKVPIPGGFDYTGGSLLLLTHHDCQGGTCNAMGVDPLPTFKATSISQRVLSKSVVPSNGVAMDVKSTRPNTRFSINYTCESINKGNITLTTTVPTNDVAITAIANPTTPNNTYGQETVTCTITNYGTSAASNFPVYYCLEGQTVPVSATCTQSIPAGQSRSFSFTANPIDLEHVYFPTKFWVYTNLSNDGFRNNDTMMIILQKPAPCVSRATTDAGADIANFTFADINNGVATPVFNNSANTARYTDYTQTVAPGTVIAGQSYQFSISNSFVSNTGSALYKYIYIDLNRDNVFTPNERVFYTPTQVPAPTTSNPANAVTRGFITIPVDATLGLTRVRVITANGTNAAPTSAHPCVTYSQGETEDYALFIDSARNVDLAVKAILHPSGNVCADPQGKIKIEIANYGTETQIFTLSNPLIVNAILETSVGIANYTTTITEGSLTEGETMIVKLDGVNYMSPGNMTVKAYLIYSNDAFRTNDTLYQWANIQNINYLATPFVTDFESMNAGTLSSPNWTVATTAASYNYTWRVFQEKTGNYPNAGPAHDHTVGIPTLNRPEGKFTAISSTNNNIPDTAKATLTSACIDLHYEFDYPKRVEFWKHIFSNVVNASDKIKIQVGSGNYFVTVDSTTGPIQTANTDHWLLQKINFTEFDEVAQIRFLATETHAKIDPALDDIKIYNGFPDIGIDEILFPIIYTDSTCLFHNDSVDFSIRIKNFGITPIYAFDLIGTAEIGDSVYTRVEMHIEHTMMPGETFDYTFPRKFKTPHAWNHQQFQARILLDRDENVSNNIKTVIACVEGFAVSVEDYTQSNGVFLGQNIPNPATSHTLIPFILPDAGKAIFNIYSMQGQLIEQISGEYDATYNTISLNTSAYSSGIYFYTLQYKGSILTKKMVIQ